MNRLTRFLFILIIVGGAPTSVCFGLTPITVQYANDAQLLMDIYQVSGSSNPAILAIHGGGFVGGGRKGDYVIDACTQFVLQGVTCFAPDYTLLKLNVPSTQGWAQFIELQYAMRWIRANSATYGVNPSKICAFGASASAYYAALLGTNWETLKGLSAYSPTGIDDPDGYSGILTEYSSHADCIVVLSVPVDLRALTQPLIFNVFTRLVSIFPQYLRNAKSTLYNVSPIARVNASTSPMYIIQGTEDPSLPTETQAGVLAEALATEGIENKLVTYVGGHSFCLYPIEPCTALLPRTLTEPIWAASAVWLATQLEHDGKK